MHLIFGRENAHALGEKYTILELDTIKIGQDGKEFAVFCAVDTIPILDMPRLDSMRSLHENLILEYRKRNWNYCIQAMEHLEGFWNHELDTFYDSLRNRVNEYIETEPDENWDGIIVKTPA